MVRTSARSRCAVACTAASLLSAGCFDTSSSVASGEYPTILTVDPILFRGSVPCGAPGLVHYVATLTEIDTPEWLPSTEPILCQSPVSFGEPKIKIDHRYIGAIDGYDRAGLRPLESGSRTMIDEVSGEVVVPRWTTTCGETTRPLSDAGADTEDGETDSGENAAASRPQDEEDAGTDAGAADAPAFNPHRASTQVIWKKEVFLRGCYPLAPVPGEPSVDAGTSADATFEAETPHDASIDHEPDGGTPDDAGGDDDGDTDG